MSLAAAVCMAEKGVRDVVQLHVRKGAEPLDVNRLDAFEHGVVLSLRSFRHRQQHRVQQPLLLAAARVQGGDPAHPPLSLERPPFIASCRAARCNASSCTRAWRDVGCASEWFQLNKKMICNFLF